MEEDGFPSDADVRARANANASERRDETTVDDETDWMEAARRAVFHSRAGRGAGVGDGLARISSEVIGE